MVAVEQCILHFLLTMSSCFPMSNYFLVIESSVISVMKKKHFQLFLHVFILSFNAVMVGISV